MIIRTSWMRLKAVLRAARWAYKYADTSGMEETFIRKTVSGEPLTEQERRVLTIRTLSFLKNPRDYYHPLRDQHLMQAPAEYETLRIKSGWDTSWEESAETARMQREWK